MVSVALRTIAAVWLAATIAFFALRLLPGDAIRAQLTEAGFSASAIDDRRAALGLDQPLATQYIQYLTSLVQGNLGHSLYTGELVRDVVLSRAGSTIALAAHGAIIMLVVACGLGIGAARNDVTGSVARAIATTAVALPSYITGTCLIFAIGLADPDTALGIWSAALVIGFHAGGVVAQALAESMRHIRHQSYIIAAHGRGLRPLSIGIRHLLPNAILPVLPLIAVQSGFLISGTVITEIVFARPGLGRLMLDAVLRRDLPIVQALILMAALIYGGLLLLAELGSRIIDPRPNI